MVSPRRGRSPCRNNLAPKTSRFIVAYDAENKAVVKPGGVLSPRVHSSQRVGRRLKLQIVRCVVRRQSRPARCGRTSTVAYRRSSGPQGWLGQLRCEVATLEAEILLTVRRTRVPAGYE